MYYILYLRAHAFLRAKLRLEHDRRLAPKRLGSWVRLYPSFGDQQLPRKVQQSLTICGTPDLYWTILQLTVPGVESRSNYGLQRLQS
jgi:hypothetical protein